MVMPKGFSEQEKIKIRQRLIAAGKDMFSTYGLKKTSVDDITRTCGISKGAFYLFFTSKEELFMEILESTDLEMKASMRQVLLPELKPTRESYRMAIVIMMQAINVHPLLAIFKSEEYENLMRKLEPEMAAEHVDKDTAYFRNLYLEGLEKGYFRAIDPDALSTFSTALFLLSLHSDQTAVIDFEKMVTILSDMFSEYIIAP
jgi:AcrR family transcriptional regulator